MARNTQDVDSFPHTLICDMSFDTDMPDGFDEDSPRSNNARQSIMAERRSPGLLRSKYGSATLCEINDLMIPGRD
jgi:hypothetical protein